MGSEHLMRNKVLVLFAVVVLAGEGFAYPTENVESNQVLLSIDSKVDAIDRKLNTVYQGQGREDLLARIDLKLDVIDAKLDALTDQDGGDSTEPIGVNEVEEVVTAPAELNLGVAEKTLPYNSSATLLSVTRWPTLTGVKFKVRFRKNAEKMFFRLRQGGTPEKEPDSLDQEDDGVWAVTFTYEGSSEAAWLIMGDQIEAEHSFLSNRHMFALTLNTSDSSPAHQELDNIPILSVKPGLEAVYLPGQDVNVTAAATTSDLEDDVFISFSFYGIDLVTNRLYMDFDRNALFTETDLDISPGKRERNVTVQTSSHRVSGYLNANVHVDRTGGSVVPQVQVSRYILVHPYNQTGAMPPDYLGLFEYLYMKVNEDSNERFPCKVGEECALSCLAVGETISELKVKRLNANGRFENVTSTYDLNNVAQVDAFRSIYWNFEANEDSGNSDGITTFKCKAIDRTHRKTVTKLMDVQVVIEGEFDAGKSSLTVQNDAMDPYIKHLVFKCAIRGRPLPDVTFSEGSSHFSFDHETPATVVHTGQNEATAIRNVTLNVEDLERLYEDVGLEYHTGPSCGFFSRTQGEYIQHYFSLPSQ